METAQILGRVFETLDSLGVSWMLTGSFASNYYGEPRSTHDADIVIRLSSAEAQRLEEIIGSDFVVSEAGASVARGQPFNAIHVPSSFKVDFWLLKEGPFDQSAFARRRRVTLFGHAVAIPSAEDLILQKLRWSQETGSEQQRRDVLVILRAQRSLLDHGYLNGWADALDVRPALEQLQREADTG